MSESFIIKGNFIYSSRDKKLKIIENGYAVCEKGICQGVFEEIPEEFKGLEIKDFKDNIIIPGMVDLHVHAPQYSFRGLGMDLELLDWLNINTFPEEAKYRNIEYAEKAYEIFVEDLKQGETTRSCIFATIHNESTLLLMDMLEKSGLHTFVGKVNMDRNSSSMLCEKSAEDSLRNTKEWILESEQSFINTKPILTPRFVPTCSDELMEGLGRLQKEFHIPVQSHLSENLSEISWVKELNSKASCYGQAYDMFGLFGSQDRTVMAHCIYSTEEEIELMRKNNVFIAHCPESNLNLASGIAPIRKYLDLDMNVGLGSDIAGGSSLSMMSAMVNAIQSSKMYWRLIDQGKKPLTFEEVFYLATLGGGKFFGNVGTFEKGYEFDVVVIDDSALKSPNKLNLHQRIERSIYNNQAIKIVEKYVCGNKIRLNDQKYIDKYWAGAII
ncbi:amidohydrolase family protein [uncultured Clostridium sp.]|uniref:amidohydrolase family protein n=1 Tax=uncultured Clostridium sp. TaxID=59620 RepID=UPI0025EE0BF5|nr:amidohydrolase family protein [uncultured Clostridium sp.]